MRAVSRTMAAMPAARPYAHRRPVLRSAACGRGTCVPFAETERFRQTQIYGDLSGRLAEVSRDSRLPRYRAGVEHAPRRTHDTGAA